MKKKYIGCKTSPHKIIIKGAKTMMQDDKIKCAQTVPKALL
jgi:hypothetical protein